MNYVTVAIGLIPIAYGVYVMIVRINGNTRNFRKLELMKKFWGERPGSIIHFISYALVPIAVGISIVMYGISGYSVTDWING